MACHTRRVLHPTLGRAVACISIHSTCFLPCLEKVIPRRGRLLDSERQAIFIHPRWEHVLREVAAAHFGMGAIEDPNAVPDLPSWSSTDVPPSPRARVAKRPERDLAAALRELGADPSATLAQAKRAFRRAALRLHPDRGGNTEAMAALNAAWRTIQDRFR